MRLSSLKLSGFKSFADSTTFHFKDSRTAVVGPNGCGKSNVIDAIRWVMGESNARQLRGGIMQDVIFTGTAKRKAVGVASVELRFDNTDGTLGGAYQAYSELSIRRQVNREGKSEYFLNGSRCRRRDITDIFLGTGLGSRSYAVIEQGMINRLVDAKPDEMRVFIEEAAGISRYQARRKETLQHLEHAEQNLSRLYDIDSELEKQLKALKRQVTGALQYKTLEQEIKQAKIELLSYQIEQNQQQQTHVSQQLEQLGEQFKHIRSELLKVEQVFHVQQTTFNQLMQQSKSLQSEWQNAEKVLAELTAQLLQKQNQFTQNQQQLQHLEQLQTQDQEKLQIAALQLEQLYAQLDDDHENYQQQLQRVAETESQLNHYRHELQVSQHALQQLQQHYAQEQQQVQQYRLQFDQFAKSIERLKQQQANLQQQQSQAQQTQSLHEITQEQQQLEQEIHILQQHVQEQTKIVQLQHDSYQQHVETLREHESELRILHTERNQLQQLLVNVATDISSDHTTLMNQLQLSDFAIPHAGLLEKILSHWLNAVSLTEQQSFSDEIARQIRPTAVQNLTVWHSALHRYPLLADWVIQPQWTFWQQVRIVETKADAIAVQEYLNVGQSLLCLDGYWLGLDWQISLLYDDEGQALQGAVRHRLRIEEIDQQLQQLNHDVQHDQQQVQQQQQEWQQSHHQLEQQQLQLHRHQHTLQQIIVERTKIESQQQAFERQKEQFNQQIEQLDEQLEEDIIQKSDLELALVRVQLACDELQPQLDQAQLHYDDIEQQVEQLQRQLQQQQQQLATYQTQKNQRQQQIELHEKDQSFLLQQQQQHQQQLEYVHNTLLPLKLDVPILQHQLDEQVQITLALQDQWQAWQHNLDQAQQQQQESSEQRLSYQQQDETLRQQLEEQRLKWHGLHSDGEHLHELLYALDGQLVEGLSLDVVQFQQQIEQKQQKLEKIGAVNLLASEEYHEISQRHQSLNHQIQDVEQTVSQLKEAMKSIDLETKQLFMDTFHKINRELNVLFPKIFNGGEATLTLEQDWQSGVKLMARPPGKKNSSLALLSGGEKALTALALVFAIFRLNPAPFCVLDEVDAPLDDANVQRFCQLVKELSEQVQFIYITHNKLAMTMATTLLGVTMPEAGISKLVSVDIEDAKTYGLVE